MLAICERMKDSKFWRNNQHVARDAMTCLVPPVVERNALTIRRIPHERNL